MIESLFNPREVKGKSSKRLEIFVAGVIFTLVGTLLAINILPPKPGVHGLGFLVVAFISIPAAPFYVQIFKIEEKEDIIERSKSLLLRHMDIIEIFGMFFLSVVFASSLFYVVAPPEVSNSVFADQIQDLQQKNIISGKAHSTGLGTTDYGFQEILSNNLVVLGLSVVFSFLLGSGAVFLISWNATIIGALIGKIASNPEAFGSVSTGNILTNYLIALPVTLLRLLPHGIFEIGAYFIGAVAGGILSAGVIRESVRKRETQFTHLKQVFMDSLLYLGISVVFVVIGAAIESSI